MKFLYPTFLYALIALAIPILIHLFNFRKFKKVYFSNVALLKAVKFQTQSTSKLKHFLILLSRLFALGFLVVAFAQPYIPTGNADNTAFKNIAVYIDNSFSMEGKSINGSLLNEAKLKALNIVAALKPEDNLYFFTNNFDHQEKRKLSKNQFNDKIDQTNITAVSRSFKEIYSRAKDILSENNVQHKQLVVISDFQKSNYNFSEFDADSTINLTLVPVKTINTSNLSIDSIWFYAPARIFDNEEKLFVKISNYSEVNLENIPVRLTINDELKSTTNVSIKKQSSTNVSFVFKNNDNMIKGKISIEDYPITFDNDYFFSYQIPEQIPVAVFYDNKAPDRISSLFKDDSTFTFIAYPVKQINYSEAEKKRLIVLNELEVIDQSLILWLNTYVENGGNLMVIPSDKGDINTLNQLLQQLNCEQLQQLDTGKVKINQLNTEHFIFNGVFVKKPDNSLNYPYTQKHFILKNNSKINKDAVIRLQNNDPFLVQYPKKQSSVYVFTSSMNLQISNFANHAFFVPVFYNIALYSNKQMPTSFIIGENNIISLPKSNEEAPIVLQGENIELIPSTNTISNYQDFFINEPTLTAGWYKLKLNSDVLASFGLNYNRKESTTACYSANELEDILNSVNTTKHVINEDVDHIQAAFQKVGDKSYWKLCIILAILFFAIETALIKLWKS